eukprot:267096-Rhodomonas_salina.2
MLSARNIFDAKEHSVATHVFGHQLPCGRFKIRFHPLPVARDGLCWRLLPSAIRSRARTKTQTSLELDPPTAFCSFRARVLLAEKGWVPSISGLWVVEAARDKGALCMEITTVTVS